ncbi:electron transport complex subunit RsxC, partial [Algiphilus sp.]|uniref:electron transport complex subunit RsxC n=1 Tax=Algiphilus sp. TaxID=1872431 RepID=UPI003C4D4792
LDTRQCLVGIEDNKPGAIAAMTAAAAGDERITVVTVPTRYPQGGEKQLIQTLTGREVPSQGLPLDIGIVCQNPGTVRAFHRAVVHGEPMIDRVISLTGNAMAHPRNVRARIGTPLSFLVAHFGGYAVTPGRLVMGGPMMGIGIPDDAGVPVVKSSNCLLAMRPEEVRPDEPAMPCIRCGACTDACPAGLLPQQLYWHARARELDKTQAYNLFDCIECGCCAAVCPSHIPLVQYYRFAKTEIWAEERERIAADAARVRHEERQRRLEREAAEKEAARAARKQKARGTDTAATTSPAPAPEPADDPVARAMAAARAKKAAAAGDTDTAATDADGGDDPIARAKAAAQARKAGKAAAKDASAEPPDADTDAGAGAGAGAASDDPVERAKAAARARKAQQQNAGNEAEAPANGENDGDDPVARAIAAAKAKKAAAKNASAEQPDTDAAPDDPVERAKAAARARKAAKRGDQDA